MLVLQQRFEWTSTSWEEGCAEARQITDRLGYPIDEGILETVVALNLLGFRTRQSCEGHLDHGAPYPWVDFETGGACPDYEQAQNVTCYLKVCWQTTCTI